MHTYLCKKSTYKLKKHIRNNPNPKTDWYIQEYKYKYHLGKIPIQVCVGLIRNKRMIELCIDEGLNPFQAVNVRGIPTSLMTSLHTLGHYDLIKKVNGKYPNGAVNFT